MAYIGNDPSNRFVAPKAASVFSGDGSTTAFTLDHAVGSDEDILVSVDGVIQEPSVAYAVSNGTTLTFTAAPSSNSGNNIFVYYLFRTVGTVSHPSNNALTATNGTLTGTLDVTGAVTANAGVSIDNITIDGTEIDLSSGDLTIDVAGDIILDADTRNIKLQDGGTDWGLLQRDTSTTTSSFVVKAMKNDSDLKLRGVDNNSEVTALTLDMSESGRAAFNTHIDMSGILIYSSLGDGGKAIQTTPSGNHSYNAGFFRNSSGSQVGGINVGSSSTAFETSSDYRLKENINYSFDATSRLKQLKPARFNFIADADTTVDGFLAHEVSGIVPEAISGEKDATQEIQNVVLNADGSFLADNISEKKWTQGKATVDEDGKKIDPIYAEDTTWVASKTVPNYQRIDQSKLVPLLVKTIQELEARITALESK